MICYFFCIILLIIIRSGGSPKEGLNIVEATVVEIISSPVEKTPILSLLDLPDRLNAVGLSTLEICHFHLPSLDQGYLRELLITLEQAHIELFSLLIDAGDITHPTHGSRDLAWITSWLAIAG